jgi:hypothetical protein
MMTMYNEEKMICESLPVKIGIPILQEQQKNMPPYYKIELYDFALLNAPLVVVIFITLIFRKKEKRPDYQSIQFDQRLNAMKIKVDILDKKVNADPFLLNAKINRLENILSTLETPAPKDPNLKN